MAETKTNLKIQKKKVSEVAMTPKRACTEKGAEKGTQKSTKKGTQRSTKEGTQKALAKAYSTTNCIKLFKMH